MGDSWYFEKEMLPIYTVINSFLANFSGFRELGDRNNPDKLTNAQKRILRAVTQFWHKKQEDIKIENLHPKVWA